MWIYCGKYKKNVDLLWKVLEKCGFTVENTKNVDLLWKVLEKCGFTVESIRKMWFYCGK